MTTPFALTAYDVSIRLGTVARGLDLEREDVPLFAKINGARFPLTSANFEIDHDGTLLFNCDGRPTPAAGPSGWYEIEDELLGWIVDQVFDGAIEDDTSIRNIYRLIARDLLAARDYTRSAPDSLRDVVSERISQMVDKGHTPEHDDQYHDGALSLAASCYVEEAHCQVITPERSLAVSRVAPDLWPWDDDLWNPSACARRNLVKSAALLLAEIDRIDRSNSSKQEASHD